MSDFLTTGSELSPLDQIRQIETEIAGQIAAARVSAGRSIANARSQAVQKRSQAREAGLAAGKANGEEIIWKTQEEARTIVVQAQNKAFAMRQRSSQSISDVSLWAFHLICGLELRLGNHDS